jgi:hypothetical protein
MRRLLLTGLLVATLASLQPVQPAHAEVLGCVGAPADEPAGGLYAERRQFVESQAWWRPEPGQTGSDHGHIHLGACIPERETLASGDLTANVRVVMHANPGTVTYASMVFKTTSMETTVQKQYVNGLQCPVGTCTRWLAFSWPVSAFDHSGLQEVRFRVFVDEPDGKRQNSSLNWQVRVENGRSRSDVTRMAYLRGKGWYTGALYCEAALLSVPLPDAPLAGVWQPTVRLDTHSSDASLPVTSHLATLDPDFHADPPVPGTVLAAGSGGLPPTALQVDTAGLVPGVHRLHLRANCRDDAQGSTNSGVLVVPFEVAG